MKMNSDKLAVTVEKLNEHNFHTWKQKIAFVLAYREVDAVVTTPKPKEGSAEQQAAWARNDYVNTCHHRAFALGLRVGACA